MGKRTFDVQVGQEFQVEFTDPAKAEKYFCQDGEFRQHFYQWHDLKEAAGKLALCLDGESTSLDADDNLIKDVEGVGIFIQTELPGEWICKDCYGHGGIVIEILDELSVQDVGESN